MVVSPFVLDDRLALRGVKLFTGVLDACVGVTSMGSSCRAVTYDEIMMVIKAVVAWVGLCVGWVK